MHRHPGLFISYGFTLIELLAVIAVIGVLAGIMLPSLSLVRERSRKANCQGNLRQLALAIEGYRLDNNGWYPLAIPDSSVSRAYFQTAPFTFGYPAFATYPDADRDGVREFGTTYAQTYLWAALIPYQIAPPSTSGVFADSGPWRCPARQRLDAGGGRPWMTGYNQKWYASYRFNHIKAATSMLPRTSPGRAVLIHDSCTPDWERSDHMHGDGSVAAAYADGHVGLVDFDTWRSLNPTASNAGQKTNPWLLDGWDP
jgi:prepilin-type N-terminal cleavage/methylation domain-containing protein/prepilin-type processing-associated H-X9-DG protein